MASHQRKVQELEILQMSKWIEEGFDPRSPLFICDMNRDVIYQGVFGQGRPYTQKEFLQLVALFDVDPILLPHDGGHAHS